jgi:hypothetical protein
LQLDLFAQLLILIKAQPAYDIDFSVREELCGSEDRR